MVVSAAVIIIIYDDWSFYNHRSFHNRGARIINRRRRINYRGSIYYRRGIITAPVPGGAGIADQTANAEADAKGIIRVPAMMAAAIITVSAVATTIPAVSAIVTVPTAGHGLHTCHKENSQCN